MDLMTSAHSSETLMQNQIHENILDENKISTLFEIEMDHDFDKESMRHHGIYLRTFFYSKICRVLRVDTISIIRIFASFRNTEIE